MLNFRGNRPTERPPGFHDVSHEGRVRRAIYVYGFTAIFAFIAAGIVFMGFDGTVAEVAVEGFLGLIQLIVIFFLTTETVDRSHILENVGRGMKARGERPATVIVQTPEQAKQVQGVQGDDSVG